MTCFWILALSTTFAQPQKTEKQTDATSAYAPKKAPKNPYVFGWMNYGEELNVRGGTTVGVPVTLETKASIERLSDRLARALGAVINLVDPDVIVLGGGLSNIDVFYSRVPELWADYIFSDVINTRLVPNKHGDASGVRGAAWLWPSDG